MSVTADPQAVFEAIQDKPEDQTGKKADAAQTGRTFTSALARNGLASYS